MEKNILDKQFNKIIDFLHALIDENQEYFVNSNVLDTNYIQDFNTIVQKEESRNHWYNRDTIKLSLGILKSEISKIQIDEGLEFTDRVFYFVKDVYPLQHLIYSCQLLGQRKLVSAYFLKEKQQIEPFLFHGICMVYPEFANFFNYCSERPDKDSIIYINESEHSSNTLINYFSGLQIIPNLKTVAFISKKTSEIELTRIAQFSMKGFGLYPNSVKHIVFENEDLIQDFFKYIERYNEINKHHHYANNYEYNRSVLLFNNEKHYDNGFVILKESESLEDKIGVVTYSVQNKMEDSLEFILNNISKIFVILCEESFDINLPQLNVDKLRFMVPNLNFEK